MFIGFLDSFIRFNSYEIFKISKMFEKTNKYTYNVNSHLIVSIQDLKDCKHPKVF